RSDERRLGERELVELTVLGVGDESHFIRGEHLSACRKMLQPRQCLEGQSRVLRDAVPFIGDRRAADNRRKYKHRQQLTVHGFCSSSDVPSTSGEPGRQTFIWICGISRDSGQLLEGLRRDRTAMEKELARTPRKPRSAARGPAVGEWLEG